MTLEEQIQAAALGQDISDNPSTPISLDLGNGQVLHFNTQEELSQNLKQALGEVNQEVNKLKQKNQEYEQMIAQQQTGQGQYVETDEQVTNTRFDMNQFIEKMRANPVEAFNYVDNFRENPYKNQLRELEELKQEYEVQKFLQAHPEFPGGQHAYVLNNVRESLGQPMTKTGLEAAYAHAVQSNKMPDFRLQAALQAQQQQFVQFLNMNGIQLPQPNQQVPQNNYVAQQPVIQQQQYPQQSQYPVMTPQGPIGIPTVPRNQPQQVDSNILQMAESLPYDKLEELLRRNGMLDK